MTSILFERVQQAQQELGGLERPLVDLGQHVEVDFLRGEY